MTVDVLKLPFQFNQDGTVAKVVQGSDAHVAQCLMSLVKTEIRSLPLAPRFGLGQMLFSQIRATDVISAATIFFPTIRIEDVAVRLTRTGRESIEIVFSTDTAKD